MRRAKTENSIPSEGFTLIELLVVMVMTALIATITLANYRAGEKQKRVSLASDGLTTALTLAQSYALAGKLTTNTDPVCRKPKYYYVTINYTNNYSLSAVNNCDTIDTIEIYTLPANTRVKVPGLAVSGCTPALPTNANNFLKIAFYPPFGLIKSSVDGSALTPCGYDVITVESTDGTINRDVVVDGVAGRIGQ